MDKIISKKNLKILFSLYFIIQPILDLAYLYDKSLSDFLRFSPSTIIRASIILLLVGVIFLTNKIKKKEYFVLIYLFSVLIYFIFHNVNSMNFYMSRSEGFSYSYLGEIFYLFRMTFPLLLIYLVQKIELNDLIIEKIFSYTSCIFSLGIIIPNILKVGISTYGGGIIKYNIFDWFKNIFILVSESSSRGIFYSANGLGVLLSALLVINYYFFYLKKDNKKILLILMQIVALIIIGTKMSTYLWIIISPLMLGMYVIFSKILKKDTEFNLLKILLSIFVIFVGLIIVFKSPTYLKNYSYFEDVEPTITIIKEEEYKEESFQNKQNYISDIFKYSNFSINSIYYTKIYPYESDPDFWYEIIEKPIILRTDDRFIQFEIMKRIHFNNKNSFDNIFGIGYTRYKSGNIYLESDYAVHFFTLGLAGVIIFLSPYLIVLLLALIYMVKNKYNNLKFDFLSYCAALSLMISASFFCGHIVDEMLTYSFLSLFAGLIYFKIKERNKIMEVQNKKISLIIPVYNTEKDLDECLSSVENQTFSKRNLEVIITNDGSTDKSLQIIQKYLNKNEGWKLIDQENSGVSSARNIAIKKAKGEYIVFLDSDDYLSDVALEKLYNSIIKNKSDMVIAKIEEFNSTYKRDYYTNNFVYKCNNFKINEYKPLLNIITICSKIYSKKLIDDICFPEGIRHEDNYFTFLAYNKAQNISMINDVIYHRRMRDGEAKSFMQSLSYKTFTDLRKNYEFIINKLKILPNYYYIYFINKLVNYSIKNLNSKDREFALNDVENKFFKNFPKQYIKFYKIYYKLYLFGAKKYAYFRWRIK